MIFSKFSGRLANNLIQNIGLSLLGEKLNLKVSNYKINSDILQFNLNSDQYQKFLVWFQKLKAK